MIGHYGRSSLAIIAPLAALTLLIGACGDGGEQEAASSTATAQPREAAFPVILEHDTRVIAAADGSDIREEPVPYKPRTPATAYEGFASPDGSLLASYRGGQLFVQEGDAKPEVIAEVPSTAESASIVWSPDARRLVFDVSFDGSSATLYVVNVDGFGLVDVGQGLEGDAFQPVWSPDSQRVAFGLRSAPNPDVAHEMYVARADGTQRKQLGEYSGYHGWEGGSDLPTWSPDGTRIGVFSPEHRMRVFDASGGAAADIGGSQGVLRFSWSPDSRSLVFDNGVQDSIIKIADVTRPGEPRQLTEGSWPRWSPSGDRIAFKRGGFSNAQVLTIRPDGSGLIALGDLGPEARSELTWSADGREVEFVRAAADLPHVYELHPGSGETTRSARTLADAGYHGFGERLELSPAADQVAFPIITGVPESEGRAPGWVVLNLASGQLTQVTDDARSGDLYWSADGVRLAFSAGQDGVYIAEGDRSPPRRISAREAYTLAWSPDGTQLAAKGPDGVRVLAADSSDERLVTERPIAGAWMVGDIEWSPDGTRLLYQWRDQDDPPGSPAEIVLAQLDGSAPRTLIETREGLTDARWAPDGETVAFVVSSEQDAGVHLIDADGTNERRIADFAGGGGSLRDLRWSPDGTRIGVVHGQSDVWIIDVATGEALLAATNVGNCLMMFLGWSPDSESVYLVPGCALGGI